ncbi:RsmE family RNA methyltransferase [Iamia sp.]|uniref:16S rRNA (uracil(1498)-N(3))-methyltransferase n=1 Tax=Iamia sp. TaxID=2722710 RepID=UPI002CCF52DD|nr:RsmE family RNA methyltransferase [Iamia sp.]HXH59549.1 RsmE family RNA methyltransferase [Iamia sp.]
MPPVPTRGTAPHAFVADVDRPVLGEDDHHHLGRALRLRPGDPLTVSDGLGRWRPVCFGDDLEPTGAVNLDEAVRPEITVALTPVKGARPEWAVQKLTELGIDRIWLLVAARSVVRWEGDRAAGHVARLEKVARQAAMQSRRTRLPELRTGVLVADALEAGGAAAAVAAPGGIAPSLERPMLLIGPEGGWSASELVAAPATVGLGPTVLRAETAAVAAGTLLVALRSGLLAPYPCS